MLSTTFRKRLADVSERTEADREDSAAPSASALTKILPGRVVDTDQGEFYLTELTSAEAQLEHIDAAFVRVFDPEAPELHEDLRQLCSGRPEGVLFLDIETTGFANCPLFLIGLLFLANRQFRIEQLFARDYSEEPGVLAYLLEKVTQFDTLVSFNGRSFDAPFINNRLVYHRHPGALNLPHVDLLHHARRRWQTVLPNCKLQTLETFICERPRMGDIPSDLIPEVYHEFVRTGNTSLLREIFHHNVLDLLTMAELVAKLVR